MDDHFRADDLGPITSRLEDARDMPTTGQLDRIRRRLPTRPAQTSTLRAALRRQRVIVPMLVLGLMFSIEGATLAIDGISSRNDANVAEYGGGGGGGGKGGGGGGGGGGGSSNNNRPAPSGSSAAGPTGSSAPVAAPAPPPAPVQQQVLPVQQTPVVEPPEEEATLGEESAGDVAPAAAQVAPSGELPFTGYAGITMLIVGLALLVAGLVLRRDWRRATPG